MTKDYAKRRRAQYSNVKRQKKPPTLVPAWGWMSIGLLLGICCAILYWQLQRPGLTNDAVVAIHEESPKTYSRVTKVNTKAHSKIHSNSPQQSARFDFYTVLPKMNQASQTPPPTPNPLELALQPLTSVTEKDNATEDEAILVAQQIEEQEPLPSSSYVIQAGSFHRHEQAETLKAQLALLGFEASIQTFKMGNRETRYRVVIGPFASQDHAYLQQQQLEQAQHLHSVVLKIKV